MVSQISWTLFLTAIGIVLVLYYGFVAIVYYPAETLSLLLGKKNKLPPGTAFQPAATRSLMGPVIPGPQDAAYLSGYQPPSEADPIHQPGPSKKFDAELHEDESSYFLVASDADSTPVIELMHRNELSPDTLLVGNVADLMDSIQTLLRVIADGAGTREDIVSFFPSLLAQYPLVADSKYRYSINLFIHDHCKSVLNADMSIDQVNELWYFLPQQAA